MPHSIKDILAVVPKHAGITSSVRRAHALARALGATLHLFLPDYDQLIDVAGRRISEEVAARAKRDFVHEREDSVQRLADQFSGESLRIQTSAAWVPTLHEGIIAKALEIGAQLIVKDLELPGLFRRVVTTPSDSRLLRLAPCDVLLTKHWAPVSGGHMAAAVDVFAEECGQRDSLNDRIVGRALYAAEALRADLDLVSSFSMGPPLATFPYDPAVLYGSTYADHRTRFETFVNQHGVPLDRAYCLAGPTAPSLSDFAEKHRIDLMVVGSVYQDAIDRLLLGSTAEILVQELECDIWVVKPVTSLDTLNRLLNVPRLRQRFRQDQVLAVTESELETAA